MNLLQKLIKERKRQGVSASELGRRIGMSRQQVYNLERTKNPRMMSLFKYAYGIDCEIVFVPLTPKP